MPILLNDFETLAIVSVLYSYRVWMYSKKDVQVLRNVTSWSYVFMSCK